MRLSIPNAIRVRLSAATPEPIAHCGFDRHPGKRDVLKPERLLNQRSAIMSNFGDASRLHVRNCTLSEPHRSACSRRAIPKMATVITTSLAVVVNSNA
jgi:hypothetical protein